MATYKQFQEYAKFQKSYTPKTCWIAHDKELTGLPVKKSICKKGERKHPCPKEKPQDIQEAFIFYKMLY